MLPIGLIITFSPQFVWADMKARDKASFHTTVFVDYGIYSLVRHPMVLGGILVLVAFFFISQHWLSAVFCVFMIISGYLIILKEEKENIRKFGNTNKKYVNKVPRMNIILGIIKKLKKIERWLLIFLKP